MAGVYFLRGVARYWPAGRIFACGRKDRGATLMDTLQRDGFKGEVIWEPSPDGTHTPAQHALYYPSPMTRELAHLRSMTSPSAYSLIGVTHSLSSKASMECISAMVLPPFQPWDAMVCTSNAAYAVVHQMLEEVKSYWAEMVGATKFVDPVLPVIPLGIDVAAQSFRGDQKKRARQVLGIGSETVFLVAGRLAFHSKGNPVPLYQALESAAQDNPVVCIEAGSYPNEEVRKSYLCAQQALAPSVRFVWLDGRDNARYQLAWQSSDVFVSLSDNIQETFGLTVVEAMAAGLPVVVSDWSGYRDLVQDGVEGFRISTVLPAFRGDDGSATDYLLGVESYDHYIGGLSLTTVVDPVALKAVITKLAASAELRAEMSEASRIRAKRYDWSVILPQYVELTNHLKLLRMALSKKESRAWPPFESPYKRYQPFASKTLPFSCRVHLSSDYAEKLQFLLVLKVANYAVINSQVTQEAISEMIQALKRSDGTTVQALLEAMTVSREIGLKLIMWSWKFRLITIA